MLTLNHFQSLVLGPGDVLLPPGRGPAGLAVLDQQVGTAHLLRLTLPIPRPTRPLPLAGVGDVIKVVHPT